MHHVWGLIRRLQDIKYMTAEEKLKILQDFEDAASAFDESLSFSEDLILYRPAQDTWSIKEQIVHCMEVDIANFHRYRRAIAEPDTQVLSFTQIWTSALDYQSSDLTAAIDLIKSVRRYMAAHLRTLIDLDWRKFAYMHDKKGRITLEEAIVDYVQHVDFHVRLIDRNIDLYKKTEHHRE
jgi:hypothetical protein